MEAVAPTPAARRTPILPSGVVAMLIFVVTELMFFAAFISAHTIVKAGALPGMWPPPGQPRLPAPQTMFNTVALLLSGVSLVVAHRRARGGVERIRFPLWGAILLGLTFVSLQGVEWVALLNEGLTLTSSSHGSFFYVVVGLHGLHAVIALGLLAHLAVLLETRRLALPRFWAVEVFWYFVVLVWPFLYSRVYF